MEKSLSSSNLSYLAQEYSTQNLKKENETRKKEILFTSKVIRI